MPAELLDLAKNLIDIAGILAQNPALQKQGVRLAGAIANFAEADDCTFAAMARTAMPTLLDLLDESIKLAAKAMTGGNITSNDSARMSELCRLIGHEP